MRRATPVSPLGILGAAGHSGNVRRDKEMTSSISPDLFAAWLSRPRARRHITALTPQRDRPERTPSDAACSSQQVGPRPSPLRILVLVNQPHPARQVQGAPVCGLREVSPFKGLCYVDV